MQIQGSLSLLGDSGHSSEVPQGSQTLEVKPEERQSVSYWWEIPLSRVTGHMQFFACDSVSGGFNLHVIQSQIQRGEKNS